MLWQSDVAHWQAGELGHSTHFNVTTTAMAPRQLLSQPHCRDGPGARSWAEYGAAAHARCVAPTLDHFGANSGQKRPGIRPASLGHGAPRERQRHRSVRRTKTAYFSHCVSKVDALRHKRCDRGNPGPDSAPLVRLLVCVRTRRPIPFHTIRSPSSDPPRAAAASTRTHAQ